MGGNECELEAAGEEADRQQPISAVPASLTERFGKRLFLGLERRVRAAGQPWRQQDTKGRHQGQGKERRDPSKRTEKTLSRRHHHEKADRAEPRADAERDAAPLGRIEPTDRAEDDGECGSAQSQPDQKTEAEIEPGRIAAHCGQRQPAGIECRAEGNDAAAAVAVGEHSGEGLGDAPDEVLQGDRQGEDLAPGADMLGDRLKKEPEGLAGS